MCVRASVRVCEMCQKPNLESSKAGTHSQRTLSQSLLCGVGLIPSLGMSVLGSILCYRGPIVVVDFTGAQRNEKITPGHKHDARMWVKWSERVCVCECVCERV